MFRCNNPDCRCDIFYRHGSYERDILFFTEAHEDPLEDAVVSFRLENGSSCVVKRIKVLRVKCVGCGTTHGVLTYDMVPFCSFLLPAFLSLILQILASKNTGNAGDPVIHGPDALSWHTLRRMYLTYKEYRNRMMAALRLQGLYQAAPGLPDVDLVQRYLRQGSPPDACLAYMRCHTGLMFVHRRSTVSYPLRFLFPLAL